MTKVIDFAKSVQGVQGVQGSVQGFFAPLHTVFACRANGFRLVCRVCRASRARVHVHAMRRAPHTRQMRARTYTPLHTLHTLHKIVVERVSGVHGSKTTPAHPAQAAKMTKPLRQTMPVTAAFIDNLRAAFGETDINAAIRAGLDGQPTFYAMEGEMEIGTKAPAEPEHKIVRGEQIAFAAPCDGCKALQIKQAAPDGSRPVRYCRTYQRPAVSKCADWSAR